MSSFERNIGSMAPSMPRAKRRKPNYSDTFEVLVGTLPNQRRFCVHTQQLCDRSRFFEASRSARWNTNKGESKKPVELLDDDPDVFESYLEVVYRGTLSVYFRGDQADSDCEDDSDLSGTEVQDNSDCKDESDSPDTEDSADDRDGLGLVKIYTLADKLGDLTSANLVADEFIRLSDKIIRTPGIETIRYAYAHTAPNSPLRKMMVDYHVHELSESGAVRDSRFLGEYLLEISLEYKRLTIKDNRKIVYDVFSTLLNERSKCHYHQHDADHPACKDD